jgi:catechol 2,3-dioxygenase-like lactoylglutathione lyase family enzyme
VGPKAVDFYVPDPITVTIDRLERAGYTARSAPQRHLMGTSYSEEVVFTGPDHLPMLVMVGHSHRPTSLRPGSPDGPFSEIATVSVICADLPASRRFYEQGLGLTAVNDAETPAQYRDLVCDLVDVPHGTRVHAVSYAEPGEPSGKVLLIHFPDAPGRRLHGRMRPGNLGFSLMSLRVDGLAAAVEQAVAAGGVPLGPPRDYTLGGARYRSARLVGPNEEMYEFYDVLD